jgi:hypothetical protein
MPAKEKSLLKTSPTGQREMEGIFESLSPNQFQTDQQNLPEPAPLIT